MRSIECGIADDLECPLNTPNHPIFTFCTTIHSYFYIVDLENFATASRRYTGDIHNSTVVGLFMTRFVYVTGEPRDFKFGTLT